jgi:hypothetical protein
MYITEIIVRKLGYWSCGAAATRVSFQNLPLRTRSEPDYLSWAGLRVGRSDPLATGIRLIVYPWSLPYQITWLEPHIVYRAEWTCGWGSSALEYGAVHTSVYVVDSGSLTWHHPLSLSFFILLTLGFHNTSYLVPLKKLQPHVLHEAHRRSHSDQPVRSSSVHVSTSQDTGSYQLSSITLEHLCFCFLE